MTNDYTAARKRLIKTLRRVIADSEQLRRDIAWWNEHRTDAAPFDAGPDIVRADIARKILAIVEAESGPIPADLWNRLTGAT